MGRRRITMEKLARDEKGYALILVLILLLVGSLIIAPLLAFMSTGLKTGMVYERKTEELYAADAGIEDAIWKLMNNEVPETMPYSLTVNGKNVAVTIPFQRDTTIALLKKMGALDPQGQGDYKKSAPMSEWMLVYDPIPTAPDPNDYDTYEITINYTPDKPNQKSRITRLGCWIFGLKIDDDTPATVVGGELAGVTYEHPIGSPALTFDNFAPKPTFESRVYYGTVFQWEWAPGKGPEFTAANDGMKVTFSFDPAITLEDGERFPANFAWVKAQTDNIFISWSGGITGFSNIIAVATSDPATGKSTTVESYVFIDELGEDVFASILTFEIDPPAIE